MNFFTENQRKVSDTYRPCAQDLLVRDAAKAPNGMYPSTFAQSGFIHAANKLDSTLKLTSWF